ncbi:MAG TPA: glutathione transferase GstA [Myxococcota bacterium]
MKLFYSSGACSLSPHIALREAELPFSLEAVDFMNGKKVPDGRTLMQVNAKGYVPMLEIEPGVVLTEGAIIVQWIADQVPDKKLAPANGTLERVRLQEWLHYEATELHKNMSPLYNKIASEEFKVAWRERIVGRLAFVANHLEGREFLCGDHFTVADGYLFYNLRAWQRAQKQTITGVLADYYARMAKRPHVAAALDAEKLEA